MVLKIHGFTLSTYTQNVLLLLRETGTPYELVEVDLTKGAHKAPEYSEHSPFALVPYMDDDGFELFGSRAICKYLGAKIGTPLVPTGDLKKVALFEQALQIEQSHFEQLLVHGHLALECTNHLLDDRLVGLAAEHRSEHALRDKLPRVSVGKHKYLAGDEVTLADLLDLPFGVHLAPQSYKWLEDKEKYPNLAQRENLRVRSTNLA